MLYFPLPSPILFRMRCFYLWLRIIRPVAFSYTGGREWGCSRWRVILQAVVWQYNIGSGRRFIFGCLQHITIMFFFCLWGKGLSSIYLNNKKVTSDCYLLQEPETKLCAYILRSLGNCLQVRHVKMLFLL